MIEITVKYKVGDRVTLIGGEKSMRIIGYEYMEGRGLRYILSVEHNYQYHYETEIQLYKQKETIGFVASE